MWNINNNNNKKKNKVKYEDWEIALSYFQKGSFMITSDLKSGYHHIEIHHPDHLTFLAIVWKFPGKASIRYFVFAVLPFGLTCILHRTFLQNVLNCLRSIGGSTVLICFIS